jgi:hypothetical protein
MSELLDAFLAGDGVDLIHESERLVPQELIEVEATEVIGAASCESGPTWPNPNIRVRKCKVNGTLTERLAPDRHPDSSGGEKRRQGAAPAGEAAGSATTNRTEHAADRRSDRTRFAWTGLARPSALATPSTMASESN